MRALWAYSALLLCQVAVPRCFDKSQLQLEMGQTARHFNDDFSRQKLRAQSAVLELAPKCNAL
jgi:hypothetical protein